MAINISRFVRILIYGVGVIILITLFIHRRVKSAKAHYSLADIDYEDLSVMQTSPSWIRETIFGDMPRTRVNKEKPLCSKDVLRQAFIRENAFPSRGQWVTHGCVEQAKLETQFTTVAYPPANLLEAIKKHDDIIDSSHKAGLNNSMNFTCPLDHINNDYFQPDICRFQYLHPPDDYLRQCIARKKIRKIITTGDSNGKYYHTELISILRHAFNQGCSKLRVENNGTDSFNMDVKYFMANVNSSAEINVTTEKRMCRSCGGNVMTCKHIIGDTIQEVILEHIPLPHFQEISMRLLEEVNKVEKRTLYFPEIIFKYYLKDNYPDLLIIFAPFNHEKRRSSKNTVTRHTQYLLSILENYLPNTVELFFIPTFHEFEPRKVWQNRGKKYEGLLANEMIDELNKMLFTSIKHKLLHKRWNYNSFWDMAKVSDEKLNDWMWDGMHMLPVWYKNMLSQILQIVCNPD